MKYFKSSEELVSMFLGLVIVLVMVGMVANYFQKRRGSVELPGIVDNKTTGTKQLVVNGVVQDDTQSIDSKYVVKQGDSLWKIAKSKYGNGYKYIDIIRENKLKNPGKLTAGQILIIPVNSDVNEYRNREVNKNVTVKEYKVVRGDSLWKIAVTQLGDGFAWNKIWNLNKNKISNPNKLEIGMILMLE